MRHVLKFESIGDLLGAQVKLRTLSINAHLRVDTQGLGCCRYFDATWQTTMPLSEQEMKTLKKLFKPDGVTFNEEEEVGI